MKKIFFVTALIVIIPCLYANDVMDSFFVGTWATILGFDVTADGSGHVAVNLYDSDTGLEPPLFTFGENHKGYIFTPASNSTFDFYWAIEEDVLLITLPDVRSEYVFRRMDYRTVIYGIRKAAGESDAIISDDELVIGVFIRVVE